MTQNKQGKDQHITAVHTEERHYPCKICPSNFPTANNLRGKGNYEGFLEFLLTFDICNVINVFRSSIGPHR